MPYEVDLVPMMFNSRYLIIDEESVIYGDVQMMFSEITGIVYGITEHETRIIGPRTTYFVKLIDSSGDELEIDFHSTVNLDLNTAETHKRIVNEMWTAFGFRIYTELIGKIKSGQQVYLGPLLMDKIRIEFTVKTFFGNEEIHSVPWNELDGNPEGSVIVLRSKTIKNTKLKVHPTEFYNGMMLPDIFKEMCGYQNQQ